MPTRAPNLVSKVYLLYEATLGRMLRTNLGFLHFLTPLGSYLNFRCKHIKQAFQEHHRRGPSVCLYVRPSVRLSDGQLQTTCGRVSRLDRNYQRLMMADRFKCQVNSMTVIIDLIDFCPVCSRNYETKLVGGRTSQLTNIGH